MVLRKTSLILAGASTLFAGVAIAQSTAQPAPDETPSTQPGTQPTPGPANPGTPSPDPVPPETPAPSTPQPDPMPQPATMGQQMPANPGAPAPGMSGTAPTMAPMVAQPAPAPQAEYPPCSATLQDQCTNTRPGADRKRTRRPRG